MDIQPFKKRIGALESAQKSGPEHIYNGQYLLLFALLKFPSW